MFRLWHKWLGPQWSIGDFAGMQAAMDREIPGWMLEALRQLAPADPDETPADTPGGPPQDLREYDPEWGDAFASERATLTCDHETMLRHVKVPVLFTHHFHHIDPQTGNLMARSPTNGSSASGTSWSAGNSFTYRAIPTMPHSLHGHDPAGCVTTVTDWLAGIPSIR